MNNGASRAPMLVRGGLFLALCVAAALVVGACAGGPQPLGVALPGAASDASAIVIEYRGSDAGEPVPGWIASSAADLEAGPEFVDKHVFIFSFEAPSLEELSSAMETFPEARMIAGAIIDRALAKAAGIEGAPDDLVDLGVRIIAAAEYAGTDLAGEFWVHEQVAADPVSRYRGWLLFTVPTDQVFAGLLLAWENASASFPPETEPEIRACEALQALFVDGL